jgi:small subunit ribosomal protein S12
MTSISQVISSPRTLKLKKTKTPKLKKNPQKKAVCLKILTISPKKPNSANRSVAKINLSQYKTKLTAKIPGENHNLQQHSTILIKGARVKDLIAVSYKAIRGKYDLLGVVNRKTRRSLYGVKKNS